MKKLLAMTLFAVLVPVTVLADNPHWLKTGATLDMDGDLNLKFKIAGLGDTTSTLVEASANASATYACMNHGGQFPDAANKMTVAGPVYASGVFTSGKNGQVTGTLTLNPPTADAFKCPPGQKKTLTAVSYDDVSLTSDIAGVAPIAGTFAAIYYEI